MRFHSMMPRNVQILLSLSFLLAFVFGDEVDRLGRPENNILTLKNRDHFSFSVYPKQVPARGDPKNVADEREYFDIRNWESYGIHTDADSHGFAHIQVDLKGPYRVLAFAITGLPAGGRKPTGEFFLEGSNDGVYWKMVGVGKPSQWHAPGTYPFRKEQIVPAIYPNSYRYYRVIAKGWVFNHLNIYNWGLFV